MTIEKILIVEDDILVRNFLAETFKRKKLDVTTAENGQKALNALKAAPFDLVVTDMKLPDITGLEILRKVKEESPQTVVIVITAYASVENAVEAMRLGAFTYLIKPFCPETIEAIIDKANEHLTLVHENSFLRQEMSQGGVVPGRIIAESPAMKQILADITNIAQSNANVFVYGESGTGKEVIAQAIHRGSLRNNKPFIKVNCAAIPETLLESEFFGHEKGAFTGAINKRLGRFELANGGTLLLDEITEIPIGVQAKLLRAIQEQEFERIGGTKPIKVDVRIVSTSNRDIKAAIAQKVLREDLYYRLNVVPLYIPPLRERKEDIIPLAEYFLEKACTSNHKTKKQFSATAKKKLLNYQWPGNVRELANVVERAVVLETSDKIEAEQLYLENSTSICAENSTTTESKLPVGITLEELEKRLIIETLQAHQNNQSKAAETLGISLRKLKSKLTAYQIS